MSNIDLNLLHVFDLLYEEGNVTKAATRLHLTQSAVSHALARLRYMLVDPLFVRAPSGLQPTERAHQLAPRLRMALAEIRSAVAAPLFDPAKTSRRFTISAGGSYFSAVIARLIALVRRSAPDISLQIIHMGPNITQALDQQQVDIVVGAFDRIPPRFRSEILFHDELVWVMGPHHPLANQRTDHKTLLTETRLDIAGTLVADRSRVQLSRDEIVRFSIFGVDDGAVLPTSAKQTKVRIVVSDLETAMAVIASTDMVTLLPRHYAETYARSTQVRIVERPKDRAETIDIAMLWHSRFNEDPGSLWLRALIREAARGACTDTVRPQGGMTRADAPKDTGRKNRKAPTRNGESKRRSTGCAKNQARPLDDRVQV